MRNGVNKRLPPLPITVAVRGRTDGRTDDINSTRLLPSGCLFRAGVVCANPRKRACEPIFSSCPLAKSRVQHRDPTRKLNLWTALRPCLAGPTPRSPRLLRPRRRFRRRFTSALVLTHSRRTWTGFAFARAAAGKCRCNRAVTRGFDPRNGGSVVLRKSAVGSLR